MATRLLINIYVIDMQSWSVGAEAVLIIHVIVMQGWRRHKYSLEFDVGL